MKRKCIALALTATLAISMLASCGKTDSEKQVDISVTSEDNGAGASTAEPEETAEVTATPTEDPGEAVPAKDVYKDYFLVGAAINGSSLDTMALHHEGMTKILKENFNSTTLSNLMKPDYLLDQEASKKSKNGMPVCNFDTCDPALEFCQENNIKMRGHTLVWHNQTPAWFFYEDYNESKKLVDKETMTKRLESYIKQVLTHCQKKYPGVVYAWDVVNECVSTDEGGYVKTKGGWKLRGKTKKDNDFSHEEAKVNMWYATMGETYVEKAFTFARKYAKKNVKLFYNDYNPFQVEKMDSIYKMCKQLKKKGILDGIGLQPTVGLTWPEINSDSEGSFKNCLRKYAKLDLEIHITELNFKIQEGRVDEDTLRVQANRYKEMMWLLLHEDKDFGGECDITSVTVFGICDDYPLYEDFTQNLYLYDRDCDPKPCYYGFIEPGLKAK
nr:endo-1,4-beta-xylanase [Eubacterium sp.]